MPYGPTYNTLARTAMKRRAQLHLAVAIMHELCHGLLLASREFKPSVYDYCMAGKAIGISAFSPQNLDFEFEPFYRNHRVAELGYALEQVLFGGWYGMIAMNKSPFQFNLTAPLYGLITATFPGDGDPWNYFPEEMIAKGAQYGHSTTFRYPIPMDFIHRFFTRRFWDKVAPQYGLKAYHTNRHVGVKCNEPALSPGDILLTPQPPSPDPPTTVLDALPKPVDVYQPIAQTPP